MNRPVKVVRGAVSAVRDRLSAVASQSSRTLLLGTILLVAAVSWVVGFVLAQYFSVDVVSSLVYLPNDCFRDWGANVGRHCFGDHALLVGAGARPNPWEPYSLSSFSHYRPFRNNYPAAAMMPHMFFGLLGKWVGAPVVGLFGYLLVLTMAVLTPAVWAARGAGGLERVVVFLACGVLAVPVWTVIDRGNSVGFVVPIALVFLVALCRQRWGLVTIMVVLAALVRPQFGVLVVVLFAARQWRLGGIAVAGSVIGNVAAYVLWPRDFPATIVQSVHNTLGYGSFEASIGSLNASFAKGLLLVPDTVAEMNNGGTVPHGFLAGPRSLIGYGVLFVVVVCVLVLGRRIPPVVAGITLLATASLFPAVSNTYYLVVVLPVAALVVRDPDGPPGSGIFDRLGTVGRHPRVVGICVGVAVALSIVQIAIPRPPYQAPTMGPMGIIVGTTPIVPTTVFLAPIAWLIAFAAIIASYTRRPADHFDATGALTRPASGKLTSVAAA